MIALDSQLGPAAMAFVLRTDADLGTLATNVRNVDGNIA